MIKLETENIKIKNKINKIWESLTNTNENIKKVKKKSDDAIKITKSKLKSMCITISANNDHKIDEYKNELLRDRDINQLKIQLNDLELKLKNNTWNFDNDSINQTSDKSKNNANKPNTSSPNSIKKQNEKELLAKINNNGMKYYSKQDITAFKKQIDIEDKTIKKCTIFIRNKDINESHHSIETAEEIVHNMHVKAGIDYDWLLTQKNQIGQDKYVCAYKLKGSLMTPTVRVCARSLADKKKYVEAIKFARDTENGIIEPNWKCSKWYNYDEMDEFRNKTNEDDFDERNNGINPSNQYHQQNNDQIRDYDQQWNLQNNRQNNHQYNQQNNPQNNQQQNRHNNQHNRQQSNNQNNQQTNRNHTQTHNQYSHDNQQYTKPNNHHHQRQKYFRPSQHNPNNQQQNNDNQYYDNKNFQPSVPSPPPPIYPQRNDYDQYYENQSNEENYNNQNYQDNQNNQNYQNNVNNQTNQTNQTNRNNNNNNNRNRNKTKHNQNNNNNNRNRKNNNNRNKKTNRRNQNNNP